ncbi:adenylate kinase family protein [Buchnera aphidicola]|uniref:adenylate kinase family protein n=1 Tax=Buchnera aphidicola TaxID=9 RepID=UPI002238BE51|nr:nucleoside monophosphate kinase [Buchnera aphidicola]MCW5197515.1 nucleoside monophosphate kinase [Buchnera aphidicola (Chaitophorus viminalis)]
MKIILIGYPCSGKGTQAKFISKKYNIPKISIGDLLRSIILNKKNKKYLDIKKKINQGELISDNIIISIIKKRLSKKDCLKGYVLDGFPRTINQAKIMDQNKFKIDYVLELLISKKKILKRMIGRQIHIQSGRIYHKIYNPPLNKNRDDITGEKLVTRKDDTKKIIIKRLNEYNLFKKEIIKYYKKKNKLKQLKFFKINAKKKLFIIQEQIQKILSQ